MKISILAVSLPVENMRST